MTAPIPKVRRIRAVRCSRCHGTEGVIDDDGRPIICSDCVRLLGRLSGAKR